MLYSFKRCNLGDERLLDLPELPKGLDPREALRIIHKDVPQPFYSFFIFAGRRILNLDSQLLNGRRIRIYHSFKNEDRLYIQFGWIKLQMMTKQEQQELASLSHPRLLWQSSRFVIAVGGELLPYRRLHLMLQDRSRNHQTVI